MHTRRWFPTVNLGTMLRLIHTYHAVPLPCRVAKGLDCVFTVCFTQCGRVWFTHAMSCPCRAPVVLRPCRSKRNFSAAWHMWINIGRLMTGLWATCPGSASSGYHAEFHEGCHQNLKLHCSWPVWNHATFLMDEEKLIFFMQEHECCIIYSTKITITV